MAKKEKSDAEAAARRTLRGTVLLIAALLVPVLVQVVALTAMGFQLKHRAANVANALMLLLVLAYAVFLWTAFGPAAGGAGKADGHGVGAGNGGNLY